MLLTVKSSRILLKTWSCSSCLRSSAAFSTGFKGKTSDDKIKAQVDPFLSSHKVTLTQNDACPQGLQGDDCSNFKLWLDNCNRYGLPNCNEQLQGIQSGRKTLAQVLAEQDKLIAEVAESYRATKYDLQTGQGVQDNSSAFLPIDSPCPQGIQGEDCSRYKLWLENCHRFGVQDCMEHYASFKAGRMTLAQIFSEQDKMIRDVVTAMSQQQGNSATSEMDKKSADQGTAEIPSEPGQRQDAQLTQRERLKRAVKEYGSTVMVFHVTISLASLGFFYLLVSSGLDVSGFLLRLDIGSEILRSKLAAGTGTFVIAYAVHKVFAPVRIAITLGSTPFIVRYLRRVGFLKAPRVGK